VSIALAILGRIWPYLLALAAGLFLFYKAEHWCNSACRDQTTKLELAQAQLKDLDRQRIAQAERWTQATAAEEARAKQTELDRRAANAGLRLRATRDVPSAAIVVPGSSLGVLADAHAAAEPTRAPAKPEEAPAPDSTASALIVWGVDVLAWAGECRDRVTAWERWYASLRAAPQ
jgi:hypothetical protein